MGWGGGVRQSNFLQSVNFSDSSQQPKMKKIVFIKQKMEFIPSSKSSFFRSCQNIFPARMAQPLPLRKTGPYAYDVTKLKHNKTVTVCFLTFTCTLFSVSSATELVNDKFKLYVNSLHVV